MHRVVQGPTDKSDKKSNNFFITKNVKKKSIKTYLLRIYIFVSEEKMMAQGLQYFYLR